MKNGVEVHFHHLLEGSVGSIRTGRAARETSHGMSQNIQPSEMSRYLTDETLNAFETRDPCGHRREATIAESRLLDFRGCANHGRPGIQKRLGDKYSETAVGSGDKRGKGDDCTSFGGLGRCRQRVRRQRQRKGTLPVIQPTYESTRKNSSEGFIREQPVV